MILSVTSMKRRRRVLKLGCTVLADLHYHRAALGGAVRTETEQAIDANNPVLSGKLPLLESMNARLFVQRIGQKHRIISERRNANRITAKFGPVSVGERVKAGFIRHREPAILELRRGKNPRIIPHTGAQKLDFFNVNTRRSQRFTGSGGTITTRAAPSWSTAFTAEPEAVSGINAASVFLPFDAA